MAPHERIAKPRRGPHAIALHTVIILCGLVPVLWMLQRVVTTWLPLPYWDEWATPAADLVAWCTGQLDLRQLFSQHNESRKFFPRLLYLGLAQLGGWDVRKEMALTFAIVVAITGLCYRLVREMPGATIRTALLAWAVAAFLCFSPWQVENLLWGVQVEVFLPGLILLLVTVINLWALPLGRKALLNGALAFIATYTVAHGMLLWVIGIPFWHNAKRPTPRVMWWSYGLYALSAASAIGAYFYGYQKPPHHPELFTPQAQPLDYAHYLVLWVGSYFNSTAANPFAVGLAAILLLVGATAGAVRVMWRRREWRSFYPGLLIASYVFLTAGITAAGRIGFGVQQALDGRYRTYSLFFFLALLLLLCALYCRSIQERAGATARNLFLALCSIAAAAAAVGWMACHVDSMKYQEGLATRNATLIRALTWAEVIPDNPDLSLLFPDPVLLRERARILREHKLLRLRFPKEKLVARVSRPPPRDRDRGFGRFETCMFDRDHNLSISGRATAPRGERLPDSVLIGAIDSSGAFKLVGVFATDTSGGDPTSATFSRVFNPDNVPAGDVTIAGWALDTRRQKAYPLGGATEIAAAQR